MYDTDVVIVGGGPAGLAAATACKSAGVRTLLLERGNASDNRDRYSPLEIGSGIGGAGLFSDGKFSFYPSATNLWKLQPSRSLEIAYAWLSALLASHDLNVPNLPIGYSVVDQANSQTGFHQKRYASFYMPLNARRALIQTLHDSLAQAVVTDAQVVSFRTEGPDVLLTLREGSRAIRTQGNAELRAKASVMATGRLGPLLLTRCLSSQLVTFRRIEVGVRLEQDADLFFLRDNPSLDPKLILNDPGRHVGWRTFCCCREGEIVPVIDDGIISLSGRADVEATGRSNVGFLVRIQEAYMGDKWDLLLARLRAHKHPLSVRLDAAESFDFLIEMFGLNLAQDILIGITQLRQSLEGAGLSGATLHGPCLEGVGYYPAVDSGLRLAGLPIWVAGDTTGIFRGLTAALVSGYFVGLQVIQELAAKS